ncbi:MAG: cyanase [Planctomycetaceae bacterium]|nr:cyanase [Planctomycetaceae bacterium]
MMPSRESVSDKILSQKVQRGLKWEQIAEVLEQSPVWTAAALSGQCYLSPEDCAKISQLFELTEEECKVLQTYPYRGSLGETVPTDPFVYRFFEIMQVYGIAMKEVTQEEFGDGIMSAIDFTIDIDRVPDPKGDRVKITYNGKFLPYRKF